jgi:hypothetical protein
MSPLILYRCLLGRVVNLWTSHHSRCHHSARLALTNLCFNQLDGCIPCSQHRLSSPAYTASSACPQCLWDLMDLVPYASHQDLWQIAGYITWTVLGYGLVTVPCQQPMTQEYILVPLLGPATSTSSTTMNAVTYSILPPVYRCHPYSLVRDRPAYADMSMKTETRCICRDGSHPHWTIWTSRDLEQPTALILPLCFIY